jgi:hypothetical protein
MPISGKKNYMFLQVRSLSEADQLRVVWQHSRPALVRLTFTYCSRSSGRITSCRTSLFAVRPDPVKSPTPRVPMNCLPVHRAIVGRRSDPEVVKATFERRHSSQVFQCLRRARAASSVRDPARHKSSLIGTGPIRGDQGAAAAAST